MKSERATSGRRYIKIGLTVDSVRDVEEGASKGENGGAVKTGSLSPLGSVFSCLHPAPSIIRTNL